MTFEGCATNAFFKNMHPCDAPILLVHTVLLHFYASEQLGSSNRPERERGNQGEFERFVSIQKWHSPPLVANLAHVAQLVTTPLAMSSPV